MHVMEIKILTEKLIFLEIYSKGFELVDKEKWVCYNGFRFNKFVTY